MPQWAKRATEEQSGTAQLMALTAVMEREGWTLAAVQRFMPRADVVETFPTYVRRHYRVARIEAVEASAEWRDWISKAVLRRARSGFALRAKRR